MLLTIFLLLNKLNDEEDIDFLFNKMMNMLKTESKDIMITFISSLSETLRSTLLGKLEEQEQEEKQ
jgi:hypothetical protein